MKDIQIDNTQKPIKAADLDRFENEIGYPLPGEYRAFLLKHNGGDPHPCDYKRKTVVAPVETIVVSISKFLPLTEDEDPSPGLRDEWRLARQELPSGFMPFGLESCGEALCFCLKKKDYGAVYVSDGYVEYLGRPAGMMRLAGSFLEFLDMLFDQKANEPIDVVYQLASCGKRQDLMDYLAKGGKLTDTSRLNRNIAQTAAAHGNLEILKACMELGGSISSCLTLAVLNHQWDTMRFLVEKGADVNEIDPVSNRTPFQSIMGVWGEERDEVEQYLRKHGAKK